MKVIVIVLHGEILSVMLSEGVTSINSNESQILVGEIAEVHTMLSALGIEDLSKLDEFESARLQELENARLLELENENLLP